MAYVRITRHVSQVVYRCKAIVYGPGIHAGILRKFCEALLTHFWIFYCVFCRQLQRMPQVCACVPAPLRCAWLCYKVTYLCMYLCMYSCMYVCIYTYTYTLYICMYIYMYAFQHLRGVHGYAIKLCIFVCIFACIHVCMYIHMYMYIHIHYIYIYV